MQWYDRKACDRSFEEREKVLVLLPILGHPLDAKYHGPYTIAQRLGLVDYVVSTPGRRKTKRVCHVSLLKPYHKRDARFVTYVAPKPILTTQQEVPKPENTTPIDYMNNLSLIEQTELKQLLDEFADIFSDTPGRTTLAVHHIKLLPNTTPIRCAPYRLHPEK